MNRKHFIFALLCVLVSATLWANPPKKNGNGEGIKFFEGTFAQALAKAKAEKKLIFLDAYTSWCGPCKMMQTRTFPDKKLGDFFNQKFVAIKIDMEEGEGPNLAETYGVDAYPTLFFIDTSGKVVKRVLGFQSAEKLLAQAQSAASK
ncbi:MAG: thioredoxin domain-containing protein [Spirosomataceae bacterium]